MTEPNEQPQEPHTNPTHEQPSGKEGEPGFKPITSEAELSAWKDGVRKSIAADVRKQVQDEQDKRDADAKADADRKAAEDRGAFEEVKQSLTKERDDAKAAQTELAAKIEKYEKLTASRVDAIKGELPAEATEDFPADADAIDQLEWLEGRKTLLAKLAPAAANGSGRPRVPATPPAQGHPKQEATSLVSRHAI